jgi:dTDP-4-dehydrorhamnose 3,5-epimerase
MDGIILTPLKKIHHPKGDLFHAMKASDVGYEGFGEAYFSNVAKDETKGWKQHTEMTLNLIVFIGEVRFVIYDGRGFFNVTLSINNYQRLSVSPGLWVAFKGIGASNTLLNLANIEHNPGESNNIALDVIDYDWGKG